MATKDADERSELKKLRKLVEDAATSPTKKELVALCERQHELIRSLEEFLPTLAAELDDDGFLYDEIIRCRSLVLDYLTVMP